MESLFRTRTSFFHKRSSGSLSKRQRAATTDIDTAADDPAAAEGDPCMICHVSVGTCTPDGETESWAVLPCGHRFGSYCVKRWLGLAEQPACPVCRTPMTHACGHPVLPLLVAVETKAANGNDNNSFAGKKTSSRASKKTALVSQNVSSTTASSPKAGHKESGARRSLSRFHRKRRRNSAPASASVPDAAAASASATAPPMPAPTRTMPDPTATCDYCSVSLAKHVGIASPSPSVVRLAVRVFASHTRSNSAPTTISTDPNHMENAYWERWRRDNSYAFGQWWATQLPPTDPAREMPTQGWVQ